MKSTAEARIKRVRALELVAAGKSYDEVAREVGFRHRGSAHRAVFKALAEREAEEIDTLRILELDRLDRLQEAIWQAALDGDLKSVHTILRIVDQRSRLLGLDRHTETGAAAGDFAALVMAPREGNPG